MSESNRGGSPLPSAAFERLTSHDLRDRLQSAFDMSQMFSIFQHLISVIDEQSIEHGRLSSQLRQLQERIAEHDALPERLTTLAAVVKDLETDLGSMRSNLAEPSQPQGRAPAVMVVEGAGGVSVALLVTPADPPRHEVREDQGRSTAGAEVSPRSEEPKVEGTSSPKVSPLGSAGRLKSLQNLLTGNRHRPLLGEVTDGQGTSLIPLEDFEAFALVRNEEDRRAVEELVAAPEDKREPLFAELVRRECIVRNVQRFKPPEPPQSVLTDRVAELERAVAEHAQSISEQRAQARGLPVFLEAVNAQLAKLQEDRRQSRRIEEELISKVREEILLDVAEAETRREEGRMAELTRRLASRDDVDLALSSRDAALADDMRALREALEECKVSVAEDRKRSRELEAAVREAARGGVGGGGKGDWRSELESLAYTVNLLSAQQVNATRSLMDDLARLQTQVENSPDEASVRDMWHDFEKDLSRWVISSGNQSAAHSNRRKVKQEADGLRDAVNRLFGALHDRPTREEVSAWLVEHAQALQRLIPEDDGRSKNYNYSLRSN